MCQSGAAAWGGAMRATNNTGTAAASVRIWSISVDLSRPVSQWKSGSIRSGETSCEGATNVNTLVTSRWATRAAIALAAALLLFQPARAQQGDRWVGTWMVAHIGRP